MNGEIKAIGVNGVAPSKSSCFAQLEARIGSSLSKRVNLESRREKTSIAIVSGRFVGGGEVVGRRGGVREGNCEM